MGYSVKTLTSVFVLTGLLAISNTMAMDDEKATIPHAQTQMRCEDIKNIGQRFISFLQKVGQTEVPVTQDEISELFDPLCKKIVNGNDLCFRSLEDHAKQLATAREAAGKWNIEKLLLTTSSEERTCSLQFLWEGEKLEKHTTMAILYLNESGKIAEIHEVFNKYNQEHVLFK